LVSQLNLRRIDLNLLIAFDALVHHKHISRAADQIGLSQPAMSNTLRRLREVFEDELLVRTPQGMQLTPRALELAGPISLILRQIERILEPDRSFDPQHAQRVFRVRMSDVLATLVLPRIDRDLHLSNSGISLDVVHLSPEATVDMLERDELDLAVSFALSHDTTIYSEPLVPDRMICAMCRTHPLAGGPISTEQFLAYRHVKVSISPTDMRFVDGILIEHRQNRDVAVNLPHWLVVPHVLRGSSFLSVMPERLALVIGHDLVFKELPFSTQPFEWRIYWHRRHDTNPVIKWLRGILHEGIHSKELLS
jgi:DNA-binding transcriptional LysR family regulator